MRGLRFVAAGVETPGGPDMPVELVVVVVVVVVVEGGGNSTCTLVAVLDAVRGDDRIGGLRNTEAGETAAWPRSITCSLGRGSHTRISMVSPTDNLLGEAVEAIEAVVAEVVDAAVDPLFPILPSSKFDFLCCWELPPPIPTGAAKRSGWRHNSAPSNVNES